MTALIPPIVPPPAPLQQLVHGPLDPLPVRLERSVEVVYGLAIVAEGGRVADLRTVRALDWTTGTALHVKPDDHGVLLVSLAEDTTDTTVTIGRNGYLRVPYRLRRRVTLFLGDPVLLAAYPEYRCMAVLAPSALVDLDRGAEPILRHPGQIGDVDQEPIAEFDHAGERDPGPDDLERAAVDDHLTGIHAVRGQASADGVGDDVLEMLEPDPGSDVRALPGRHGVVGEDHARLVFMSRD
ncbi:hypothetical protein GZH49_10715 [Nocardia terpenica]|uniref:hypothetical protein n=1 Tax=Nocardia terpenica TaxID=455432 RepID=UPI002FDFFAA8